MFSIDKSIEVDVPVHTAVDQWAEFEQLSRSIRKANRQEATTRLLRWRARLAERESDSWIARLSDEIPDESVVGRRVAGEVTFRPLGTRRTRVTLHLAFAARAGDAPATHAGGERATLDFAGARLRARRRAETLRASGH